MSGTTVSDNPPGNVPGSQPEVGSGNASMPTACANANMPISTHAISEGPPLDSQNTFCAVAKRATASVAKTVVCPQVPFSALHLLKSDKVKYDTPGVKMIPDFISAHTAAFTVPPETRIYDVADAMKQLTGIRKYGIKVNRVHNYAVVSLTSAEMAVKVNDATPIVWGVPSKPVSLLIFKKSLHRVTLSDTGTGPDLVTKTCVAYEAMSQFGTIHDIVLYRDCKDENHIPDVISLLMDFGDLKQLPCTVQMGNKLA
ncbi:hypothetical protein GGI07_005939 [Coemansia sp. Benny D115]|nr:hypothetical protein GGI07_005939 [Coemansia sp. Benny D115]